MRGRGSPHQEHTKPLRFTGGFREGRQLWLMWFKQHSDSSVEFPWERTQAVQVPGMPSDWVTAPLTNSNRKSKMSKITHTTPHKVRIKVTELTITGQHDIGKERRTTKTGFQIYTFKPPTVSGFQNFTKNIEQLSSYWWDCSVSQTGTWLYLVTSQVNQPRTPHPLLRTELQRDQPKTAGSHNSASVTVKIVHYSTTGDRPVWSTFINSEIVK